MNCFKLFFFFCLSLLFHSVYALDDSPQFITTAKSFELAKKNASYLALFLENMPKGADLHVHIDGAAYAEDLIRFGLLQSWCVNPVTQEVTLNKQCPTGNLLANVIHDQTRFNALLEGWSMQDFPLQVQSGEMHFFATFLKYLPLVYSYLDQSIASIVNRAGLQNETYLELMLDSAELNVKSPNGETEQDIGNRLGYQNNFFRLRQNYLSDPQFKGLLKEIITKINQQEIKIKSDLQCQSRQPQPGCQVTVKYLYLAFRHLEPGPFFSELLMAFEVAQSQPDVLGINIVMPENGYNALKYYHLQMQMIGFLHQFYPKVHISLHAGELIPGLVEPNDLRFHIRDAINTGHAERIGHGVDIPYEDKANELLQQMAKQKIMVEINLTSNHDILGLAMKNHPLPLYLEHRVPVAISTDDEAVLRTTLTHELLLAIQQFDLNYSQVKRLIRNSLSYNFVSGKSLWQSEFPFQPVTVCQNSLTLNLPLEPLCQNFLSTSPKAKLQWELEKAFLQFEKNTADLSIKLNVKPYATL